MTVWWSRTWLSTEPRQYFVSSLLRASSTASEIAIPREPRQSGSFARTALPASVNGLGEGIVRPPNTSIIALRYGFWSNEHLTMKTVHSRPKMLHACESAEPHWPAPVSVVTFLVPHLLFSKACAIALLVLWDPEGLTPSYLK